MAGRLLLSQAEPGFTLPALERLAPPPPPGLVAADHEANGTPAAGTPHPIRKHYRCTVCRDQQGGGELRTAAPDEMDLRRARRDVGAAGARRRVRERFPVPEGGDGLVRAILALH